MSEISVMGSPEDFDIEGFLRGFEPQITRVNLYKRADLIPRLNELANLVEEFNAEESEERSIDEYPQVEKYVAEYDELFDTINASENVIEFQFKPASALAMADAVKKAEAAGYSGPEHLESIVAFQVAASCVQPAGITGEAILALRAKVGDLALKALFDGWAESLKSGADAIVPFLHSVLPTTEQAQL